MKKQNYNIFKDELNHIYEGIWYELGEKWNKYFLNLEKSRACPNILRKIFSENQEITDLTKINSAIFWLLCKSL